MRRRSKADRNASLHREQFDGLRRIDEELTKSVADAGHEQAMARAMGKVVEDLFAGSHVLHGQVQDE